MSQKIKKIVAVAFTYSLLGYLAAFLLENIFPGFVSRNFDLNYLLYAVLIFGLLSSIWGKAETKIVKSPASIWDWLLAIGLSVVGGSLIYFKLDLEAGLRITVSVLSTLLIGLLSAILLWPEANKLNEIKLRKPTSYSRKGTVGALIAIVIFGSLIGAGAYLYRHRQAQPTTNMMADKEMTIKVMAGSLDGRIAPAFVKVLNSNGFVKAYYGDADRLDYSDATIIFDPDEKDQADIIMKLLEPYYSRVTAEPPLEATPREITVILGYKTDN